jgi:hypothetical protein
MRESLAEAKRMVDALDLIVVNRETGEITPYEAPKTHLDALATKYRVIKAGGKPAEAAIAARDKILRDLRDAANKTARAQTLAYIREYHKIKLNSKNAATAGVVEEVLKALIDNNAERETSILAGFAGKAKELSKAHAARVAAERAAKVEAKRDTDVAEALRRIAKNNSLVAYSPTKEERKRLEEIRGNAELSAEDKIKAIVQMYKYNTERVRRQVAQKTRSVTVKNITRANVMNYATRVRPELETQWDAIEAELTAFLSAKAPAGKKFKPNPTDVARYGEMRIRGLEITPVIYYTIIYPAIFSKGATNLGKVKPAAGGAGAAAGAGAGAGRNSTRKNKKAAAEDVANE